MNQMNSFKDFHTTENYVKTLFNDEIVDKTRQWFETYTKLMAYYRCAMMEIETKFNVLNEEFSLQLDRNPINGIKSRIKNPLSLREKLERKHLPVTIQNIEAHINDVAGVRVVCSFPEDVYTLANALLNQDDITLIEEKDYIKNPKPNGYRSLHLIVSVPIFLAHEKKSMRVEIQIRTIAMDFWASLEHQLRYKKDFEFTKEIEDELLYCATLSAELDSKMDKLKTLINTENDNKLNENQAI